MMKLSCVLCLCVLLCCAFLLAPVSAGALSCTGEACIQSKDEPGVPAAPQPELQVAVQAASDEATALLSSKSCDYINLRAPWGKTCPKYSWFNCATKGTIKGYRVKVVPAGLIMFHGSTTVPDDTSIAPGLAYYSGYLTAKYYRDRVDWDRGSYPKIHVFRTTAQFPVVDLMDPDNQRELNTVLRRGLHGKADRKGMSVDYPLQSITSYPKPLLRTSYRSTDRLAFEILCEDWTRKGIWGFAGYYKVGELHPELVLCSSKGVVERVSGFRHDRWSEDERNALPNKEIPDYQKLCK